MQQKMQAVNRAYAVLMDPEARKRYDETGEDPKPSGGPSPEQMAREVLADLIGKWLQSDNQNLVKMAQRAVKGAESTLQRKKKTRKVETTERAIVGASNVLTEDLETWEVDWRKRYRGRAWAVVRPADAAEVAAVVRACATAGLRYLPGRQCC